MTSQSLEYDEIDVVELPLEDLIQNINARALNFKDEKSNLLLRKKTKVDFSNIDLKDNILTITKAGNLLGTQQIYDRVSGRIHVQIEVFDGKTRLKAQIIPDFGIMPLYYMLASIVALVFGGIFASSHSKLSTVIVFTVLIFLIWTLGQVMKREFQIALTQYYKNYLFNIVNA